MQCKILLTLPALRSGKMFFQAGHRQKSTQVDSDARQTRSIDARISGDSMENGILLNLYDNEL